MTREEAIQVLHSESVEISGNAVNISRFFEALDIAIAILHDVPDTDIGKNEPLTLDELWEMDGEPVWVCFSGLIIYEDGWFIITETEKCEALLKGKASVYKDFECYGKTWMAYRQKPKEGTNE